LVPRFVTFGISRRGRILVVAHTGIVVPSGRSNVIGSAVPGAQRVTNEDFMKKTNRRSANDMLPDYGFASMKGAVRGKYAAVKSGASYSAEHDKGCPAV